MFESMHQYTARNSGPKYASLATSIAAHSALACAIVFSQLFLFESIPQRDIMTLLTRIPESFDSLRPSPPPTGTAGGGEARVPEEKTAYHINVSNDDMEMPSQIPSFLPPPTDGPVLLRTAMNAEGIRGINGGNGGTSFVSAAGLVPSLDPTALLELKMPKPPSKAKVPLRIGVLNPSKLIFQISPKYPVLAHKLRVSGTVTLEALIDEEGAVSRVEVVEGHALLRDSAVEAVKQWKYSPTIQNGEPISIVATIKIIFKIGR